MDVFFLLVSKICFVRSGIVKLSENKPTVIETGNYLITSASFVFGVLSFESV